MLERLQQRSNKCELCGNKSDLNAFEVLPSEGRLDQHVLVCNICQNQINDLSTVYFNHWRCLNDSMWSVEPAVQVLSYRMLSYLSTENWAQDLLEMMYLDDDLLKWAKLGLVDTNLETHKDSNGAILNDGDTVVLIKDLEVKGANFTAKRGTSVRNISLVADNCEHIEGKVESQRIVILTKFVKKQG